MNRKELSKQYLFNLVLRYEALEAERQQLLAAATRINEIQAEKTDLISDAQDALMKFNALFGTSYTLPQVRAWYNSTQKVMTQPPPSVVVPNLVGRTQAEATALLAPLELGMSISQAPSDTVAEGLIISTVPAAGGSTLKNTAITVLISSGPVVTP